VQLVGSGQQRHCKRGLTKKASGNEKIMSGGRMEKFLILEKGEIFWEFKENNRTHVMANTEESAQVHRKTKLSKRPWTFIIDLL